ncbi:Protein F43D2.6 [Aphelenchoides avenae]|nr:Protein F43D2.6 [Aphelenchus avenae]
MRTKLLAILFVLSTIYAVSAYEICPAGGPNGEPLRCPFKCCHPFESSSTGFAVRNYYCCGERSGQLTEEESPSTKRYQIFGTTYTVDDNFLWGIFLSIVISLILSIICCLLCNVCLFRRPKRSHVYESVPY